MRIYAYDSAVEQTTAERVTFWARRGYVVVQAAPPQAHHCAAAQSITVEAEGIQRIDAALTLDEAEALLCDGLDVAGLLTLVAGLGVETAAGTVRGLRGAVRRHLEGTK